MKSKSIGSLSRATSLWASPRTWVTMPSTPAFLKLFLAISKRPLSMSKVVRWPPVLLSARLNQSPEYPGRAELDHVSGAAGLGQKTHHPAVSTGYIRRSLAIMVQGVEHAQDLGLCLVSGPGWLDLGGLGRTRDRTRRG